ncbi:hypothetical protein GXW78_03075 [Roseomonas terrae]|uniref:Uncharacterized protein n=1 Tax=Neoroseomonas terrae TaxID=424799 RepID=A0ABS5EC87_9PROT|nr:hypothetical protein [Neoroseomonas terrae]MBR0648632.1 hypothetical protein [Neoroseomonas terrae]
MATQKNNGAAAFFWMKAGAGWREKQEIDIKAEQRQRYVIRVPPRLSEQEWLDRYAPKPLP